MYQRKSPRYSSSGGASGSSVAKTKPWMLSTAAAGRRLNSALSRWPYASRHAGAPISSPVFFYGQP